MAIVYLIDNNFYEFWGALQNSIVRGVTYRLPRLLVNLAMIILAQTDWPVQWRILKCKLYKLYILSFNKTAVGLKELYILINFKIKLWSVDICMTTIIITIDNFFNSV